MQIQYPAGPERKKLAAAAANQLETKSSYAGMPTAQYDVGEYIISCNGTLIGPDNRELVAALKQQGFEPMEEAYDSDSAQPDQPNRLTIEIPIGPEFTPAKMMNLEKLVASRETLLKKVLGADALPIEQEDGILRFAWFTADDNAMVYGQLVSALVRVAVETTRITAREKPAESEKFRMRTYLLKLGFIGDDYKQARRVLTRGLSGSGSYARVETLTGKGVAANE